ncbi:hypothetical protein ES703_67374 [subsurface metagenome]
MQMGDGFSPRPTCLKCAGLSSKPPRGSLRAHRWEYVRRDPPDLARFYPPGTDLDQTNQLKEKEG